RRKAVNCWQKAPPLGPKALAAAPACWATIDYRVVKDPNLSGDLRWAIEEPRTVHGICVWFDTELADGIGFSNSPLAEDQHVYGRGFFPWPDPVELARGDVVRVSLRANLTGEDYIWCWNTSIVNATGASKATFR